jgi:hypothetical protein
MESIAWRGCARSPGISGVTGGSDACAGWQQDFLSGVIFASLRTIPFVPTDHPQIHH